MVTLLVLFGTTVFAGKTIYATLFAHFPLWFIT